MAQRKVSLMDIFEYLGTRRRPMEEGEALFKAGHVIMCGYKIAVGNEIFGLCLQTSSLYSPPHEITIILSDSTSKWECKCSCKAGNSSRCKHVFAVLIYVNRHEELEVLSCTDIQQSWGKEKEGLKEIYEVVPIGEFCHPTGVLPKKEFKSSEALNTTNFEILHKCDDTSALGKFKTRQKLLPLEMNFQSLAINSHSQPTTSSAVSPLVHGNEQQANSSSATVTPSDKPPASTTSIVAPPLVLVLDEKYANPHIIVEHLLKTNAILSMLINEPSTHEEFYNKNIKMDMTNIIHTYTKTCQQGSQEWKQARKYRITGSVCYSFYTYSKNKSPNWDKRINDFINPRFQGNNNTNYGTEMEPKAKKCYDRKYGCTTKLAELVVAPLAPWLAFSPDALQIDGGNIKKVIEFKCPTSGKVKTAEEIVLDLPYIYVSNGTLFVKEKHAYYGQIQLGMCLLNVATCDFVVYSSFDDTCVVISVNYDQVFVNQMITLLHKTYFEEILPRIS